MKFFGGGKSGSNIILKGVPFEFVSFSNGTALGPAYLRYCAESIEIKSTRYNAECYDFEDLGDINCYGFSPDKALKVISIEAEKIFKDKKFPVFIGGDHTITYPLFKIAKKFHPELRLLILDAHTDFRDEFMGIKINHATWLKRLYDEKIVKDEDVYLLGIRENYPETPFKIINKKEIENLKGIFYLSFDLDVINPREFTSVSNPAPGGLLIEEVYYIFEKIYKKLVCIDFVEFNPLRGDAFNSGVFLSFLLRDLVVLLSKNR